MRVTVRAAASLLNVEIEKVYDWIEAGDLPAYKINDEYRINRSELLEWATTRKLSVAPALFKDEEALEPSVQESLGRGGIFRNLGGATRQDALKAIVQILPLADDSERDMLLQMFMARESVGSTGVGDGIAIPHVRNPIVLTTDDPILSLCFLNPPVDFGAFDGKPIYAMFVLICPTIHIHLQMLAKLAYLLRISEFSEMIRAQAPDAEIMAAIKRLEEAARNEKQEQQ